MRGAGGAARRSVQQDTGTDGQMATREAYWTQRDILAGYGGTGAVRVRGPGLINRHAFRGRQASSTLRGRGLAPALAGDLAKAVWES